MAEETKEMKQVGMMFDGLFKKPFSQASHDANDGSAKKVTCRVFKQHGIELSEFTPQGSVFHIDLCGQYKKRTKYVECGRTQNTQWNGFEFPDSWGGIHVPARKEATLNADRWPKNYDIKQKDIYYSLVNRYLSFIAVCFDTSAILNSPKGHLMKSPIHQPDYVTADLFYIVPTKHWKIKENPQPNTQAPTDEI